MDPTHNKDNPVSELGVLQTRKTPQNVSQCELENSLTNLVDRTKCKRRDLTGIIKGIVGIFGKYGTKGFGTFQDELEGNGETTGHPPLLPPTGRANVVDGRLGQRDRNNLNWIHLGSYHIWYSLLTIIVHNRRRWPVWILDTNSPFCYRHSGRSSSSSLESCPARTLESESNIDKRLTIIGIWEIGSNYDLFFCNCRLIRKLHSPGAHIPR